MADVGVLLDKSKIRAVYLGGEPVKVDVPAIDAPREVAFSYAMWRETYDQAAVAELAQQSRLHAMAAPQTA